LEKSIFKALSKAAVIDYATFIARAATIRTNLPPIQYKTFLKIYHDVGSKIKGRSWTGKRDIKDLGYDCAFTGKSLTEDILLAAQWLTFHSARINHFVQFTLELQELILKEEYSVALDMAESFQKANGWSFWILEAIFYLTNKTHGSEAARKLAKKIKEQSDNRIINFAATIFSERVDDRYSIDAFASRWSDIIPNHLKKPHLQSYYLFHALGISDLSDSLGSVICQDFCNSIYDCYNTFVEAIFSIICSTPNAVSTPIRQSIDLLVASGISDIRLIKIQFLFGGELLYNNAETNSHTQNFFNLLINHSSGSEETPDSLKFIEDLSKNGTVAIESLSKLEKESLGLRFLPIGLSLNDFSSNLFGKERKKSTSQPWATLLSQQTTLDDVFILSSDQAWSAIRRIADSKLRGSMVCTATCLIDVYDGKLTESTPLPISNNSILWLGYELVEQGRHDECELIIKNLSKESQFWQRQAKKLSLTMLSQTFQIEKALDLAYSILEENHIYCFEYPFANIFLDNSWADLKSFNPTITAIVAHFTNATLETKDEDILYICKMACKKIHEMNDGKKNLNDAMPLKEKNAAITLLSNVWVEENLTFLNFKTSRDAMNDRLEVLRLLVQVNPDSEQVYASEVMDITLRESQWEGLSHVDETRVFVNEAGIMRWAEKELRQDFETWKKAHAVDDAEAIADKLMKIANLPPDERLAELADGDLSEDNKILLTIISRLESKFINDPLDGLHCYLSARIRHGTIKNTFLGPLDEAGFLVVGDSLDVSIDKYLQEIHPNDIESNVRPALLNLSKSLVLLINDALTHKIRIKSDKHPGGYIYIGNNSGFFNKTAALVGSMLDFTNFITVTFTFFWKQLEPSLQRLHDYFLNEFQQNTYNLFDQAILQIESVGDGSRGLVTALTRIKNQTCQKCVVAAGWFQPHSNLTDRVFSLEETISIAVRASKNIYPRFNAIIEVEKVDCLDTRFTAVGMAALVEALSTLFENCWKYSGLYDKDYTIDVMPYIDTSNNILSLSVSNPVSHSRVSQLTPEYLRTIRDKFQNILEFEFVASEGGTGLPKIARLSYKVDRSICAVPLDIKLEGNNFVVTAFIPLHERDEAFDVYTY
jgi:hypothetical protein